MIEHKDQPFPLLPVIELPKAFGHVLSFATGPVEQRRIELPAGDLAGGQELVDHPDRDAILASQHIDLDRFTEGPGITDPACLLVDGVTDLVQAGGTGITPKQAAERVVGPVLSSAWNREQSSDEGYDEEYDKAIVLLHESSKRFIDFMCTYSFCQLTSLIVLDRG